MHIHNSNYGEKVGKGYDRMDPQKSEMHQTCKY